VIPSLLLLSTVAQAADCPSPVTMAALHAELAAAEAAFGSMDLSAFDRHHAAVFDALPCLSEPVSPADAAQVHRVQALAAFMAEDRAGTVASFRAAASLDPSWELDASLAPPGHPLREQLETARVLPPSPRVDLGATGALVVTVDGERDAGRPTDQPTVLQGLSASGAVQHTGHVGVGEALPAWIPVGPSPTAAGSEPDRATRGAKKARAGFSWARPPRPA